MTGRLAPGDATTGTSGVRSDTDLVAAIEARRSAGEQVGRLARDRQPPSQFGEGSRLGAGSRFGAGSRVSRRHD
jgi:hypothetical protein